MKIIQLQSQNIKNLRAIEINPEGTAVILTGANEAGKSAVLDSIMLALTGEKMERPIRDGQDRAEVNVDLGKYKVKRVWTHNGERLEVTNPEGARYSSPQSLLDKILGDLSFDPLAFKNLKAKEQRELLLQAVGMDFSAGDLRFKELYEERTLKNRDAKRLEAQLAGIEPPSAELPETEVSISGQMATIGELEGRKAKHDKFLATQHTGRLRICDLEDEISASEKRIEELKATVSACRLEMERIGTALSEMTAVTGEQVAAAKNEIEKIEAINVRIREGKKYRELKGEFESVAGAAQSLTADMEALEREKVDKVKSCKFPVEGLSVSDESVLFEGVPFGQLSDGRKIRISAAIAMALNPSLRIILVREGSLLDAKGLAAIVEMAKEKDYQIWMERCDESGKIGIYIEAGEIKGVNKTE